MRIYFVRHGESVANVLRVISNRGWQHGLTEKGRAQAAALAESLSGVPARRIYTSPLRRAVETAQILSAALGVPYETTGALREFDCGEAENKSDPETWAKWEQLWVDWFELGHLDSKIPGGECWLEIEARFRPFVERLAAEEPDPDAAYILIGHGGLYIAMLPSLLPNLDRSQTDGLNFPNTAYVLAESKPEGLVCLEWCGKKVSRNNYRVQKNR